MSERLLIRYYRLGKFQENLLLKIHNIENNGVGEPINAMGVRGAHDFNTETVTSMPQVYTALRKLVALKLLSSEVETVRPKGQSGAPRRFYSVTEFGKRYLLAA